MKSLLFTALLATTLVLSYIAFTQHDSNATEEAFNSYKVRFGKVYSPE